MRKIICAAPALIALNAAAHESADPLLFSTTLEQLEWRAAEGEDPLVLEGHAWWGYDLQKLWLELDADYADGELEELELQALYSRALSPYWDWQAGVRFDHQPDLDRTWAALAIQGLAPYFFEAGAAVFIGEDGALALRLKAEYEILFTQQWILSPELSLDFYGQNDAESATGSGLSSSAFGWRLRYEIRPEVAPYLGVHWSRQYGNTADFARAQGEADAVRQWVLGVRFWF